MSGITEPWVETLGVTVLAVVGVTGGLWFSKLPGRLWSIGYWLPLTLIALIGISFRFTTLQFIPPISWLVAGRSECALAALIGSMVLTTPLARLPNRRDRIVVALLMVLIISKVGLWPFLAPAFNQAELKSLKPRYDPYGVCLQNTDYTCGSAAAVTALRSIGLVSTETEIALLAKTTSVSGTPPDVLADALQTRFQMDGIHCEYRCFRKIDELKAFPAFIALVKFSFLLDHYVAVLEVNENAVIIGDPLFGRESLTHKEFAEKWRFSGVVLDRKPSSEAKHVVSSPSRANDSSSP